MSTVPVQVLLLVGVQGLVVPVPQVDAAQGDGGDMVQLKGYMNSNISAIFYAIDAQLAPIDSARRPGVLYFFLEAI